MQPAPPCPAPTCWWQKRASGLLLHLCLYLVRWKFCVVCLFVFPFQVMLPSVNPKIPIDTPVREFPTVWTSPSWLPSQEGSHSPNLLSLFLSFIFCPTSFWRDWAAFLGAWCFLPVSRRLFVEVSQHSNELLMNLWRTKCSPHPIPPPSWDCTHQFHASLYSMSRFPNIAHLYHWDSFTEAF